MATRSPRRHQKPRTNRQARRTKPSQPQAIPVPATWEDITKEYTGQSLKRLLSLSALLSADDALGGRHWSELNTFRNLHPALLQNFTRAILASNANYEAIATPSTGDFLLTLVNGVGKLQNHPSASAIRHMDGAALITNVFSPMWRQQARLDARSILLTDLGRAHATLVHFPNKLGTEIAEKQKAGYVHLDNHFKASYGCSIDTVLQGLLLIFMRYQQIFNGSNAFNPHWLQKLRPGGGEMKVDHNALKRYVDDALPSLDHLTINGHDLTNYLKQWLPPEEIPHLLTLLSATIEEVRTMLTQSPFSSGMAAFAPLPLELKPLLKLPNGDYLIPNLRSMLTSMARLPLNLLASDPNPNVMTCYGQGLEGYAVAATLDCVASTCITAVPEFRYKHPDTNNSSQSADVTLLEPGKLRTLVEVKAKRFPDWGLAHPGNDAVKALDDLITETVKRGMGKGKHLDTRILPEHMASLLSASTSTLVVVVYGETVPNFDGVFRSRIDAHHDLHQYLGHFVAMSIGEYEHHLDIAKERGESVIDLLQKSAEEFRDRGVLQMISHTHLGNTWPKNQYVDQYMTELLKRLPTPGTD